MTKVLTDKLTHLATMFGERIMPAPTNSISFALTLSCLDTALQQEMNSTSTTTQAQEPKATTSNGKKQSASLLGSQLFYRNVSGCRVITRAGKGTRIGPHTFVDWGAHHTHTAGASASNSSSSSMIHAHSYLTAACALGVSEAEIELFAERLEKCMRKLLRQNLLTAVEQSVN